MTLTWSVCVADNLGGVSDPTHRLPLFHSYDVVEDVIPAPPLAVTQVVYQNGQEQIDITIARNYSPVGAARAPKVKFPTGTANNLFSLFMVDPDAPSRANPVAAQWLHWAILNIPSDELEDRWLNSETAAGELKATYSGPNPPPASGDHRYVLLIYRHSTEWQWTSGAIDARAAKGRAGFSVQEYVNQQDEQAELASATFWLSHHLLEN